MPSFLLIAKAVLRGTLRAATTPVSISNVLKAQPFPNSSAVTNKLAVTLIQELVSEGADLPCMALHQTSTCSWPASYCSQPAECTLCLRECD